MTAVETVLDHPIRRRIKATGIGIAVLAAIGAIGFAAFAMSAKLQLAQSHPPPGQLVNIGGQRLHLNCIGEARDGAPTVILEAGNADFSVVWSRVQPELAAVARTCAYDRAGLGWSDPASAPRTLEAMSSELDRLLSAAQIEGPLVLVGHSFGGIVARQFASDHSARIAGIVLVDPAHEDQINHIPGMGEAVKQGVAQFEGLVPLASMGLLALAPHSIPNRGLPESAYGDYAAILATTGYFAAAAAETAALPSNLDALGSGDLGSLPLTVVSRGKAEPLPAMGEIESQEMDAAWQRMQGETAQLSTASTHIIAESSGHYVQLERPDLVIDAVARMVRSVK